MRLDRQGDDSSVAVSCDGILDLEAAVTRHPFMGAEMGATLNDVLMTRLFAGKGSWSASAVARDVAEYAGRTLFLLAPQSAPVDRAFSTSAQGKILCTWISEHPRFANLILPVVEQIGPEKVVLLGSTEEMRKRVPHGAAFVGRKEVPRAPFRQWYVNYLKALPRWNASLVAEFERQDIPKRILPKLHLQLVLSCAAFAAHCLLLDRLRPTAVLTEYDRNSFTAPLILAARARGIPTLTMVHGAFNAACGYTPLLADRVLVWGRKGRASLIGYGVADDRIDVVGSPAVGDGDSNDREEALAKVGLPPEKSVVLLATNPIRPASRSRLAEVFCSAFTGESAIAPVVRLHPSEDVRFYEPLAARFPDVLFLKNAAWSLDESLCVADVVVCHNSAYGLDALVKSKPVVILDVLPESLLSAESFVTEAGCPRARSDEELAAIVNRLLDDKSFRESVAEPAREFVAEVYESVGEEAAKRTARRVLEAANKHMGTA